MSKASAASCCRAIMSMSCSPATKPAARRPPKSCLQNTRVLAVDQSADERATKATVSKSVTLEVDTVDAQKVWLAASVGNLSLLLRKAGETAEAKTRQISLKDLAGNLFSASRRHCDRRGDAGSARQDYKVPMESRAGRTGRKSAR